MMTQHEERLTGAGERQDGGEGEEGGEVRYRLVMKKVRTKTHK